MTIVAQAWATRLYSDARKNAAARDIPFSLSRPDFDHLVRHADGRCMVTTIPFEFGKFPGSSRRPFAPSLDRIDSALGYTAQNCRLVCVIVNLAMNQWGIEPLLKMAHNLVAYEETIRARVPRSKQKELFGYTTPKEYFAANEIPHTPYDIGILARRAKKYCDERGIAWEHVPRPTGYVRKDGSLVTEHAAAFPVSVLAICLAELQAGS